MTFLELQTEVERRLIDLPAAVQEAVPSLVNEAIRALEDKHNFKCMEALLEASTVLDTRELEAKPSDWKESRGRAWMLEDLGSIRWIDTYPDTNSALAEFDNEDSSEAQAIVLNATTVDVYPLPDGNSDYDDGEYRIKIPYWKYLPELSADADTNWFSINAPFYIIEKATSDGFAIDWDEGRANYWGGRADKLERRAILKDKYEALSTVDTLVLNKGPRAPYGRN